MQFTLFIFLSRQRDILFGVKGKQPKLCISVDASKPFCPVPKVDAALIHSSIKAMVLNKGFITDITNL